MSEASTPGTSSDRPVTHKIIARNVITGVLTTVLGATVIYFLGFNHRSDGNNFLVMKEATTNAWKSYESFENTYTKNSLSLIKDAATIGLDEFLTQTKQESEKFKKSVEELAKKKDIDKDLVTALNKRLDNEKSSMPKVEKYIDELRKIANSTMTDQEKTAAVTREDQKYAATSSGLYERAVNDIQDIAKILSARYGQPFSMDDFLIIQIHDQNKKTADSLANLNRTNQENNNNNNGNQQPVDPNNIGNNRQVTGNTNPSVTNNTVINERNLTGDWSTADAKISLMENDTMSWDLNSGENAYGTWKIINNQLYMYVTNSRTGQKFTWIFDLSNVAARSFTMTLTVQPYNTYKLVRMED